MTRGRGHAAKSDDEGAEGSLRRCIVTGEVTQPERMVRFVAGPDTVVVPDVAHKLPGRGCWVIAQRDAIAKACERKAFARALKSDVKCPPDLAGQVEQLLVRRVIDHLGLARRAGLAVIGYAQVEEAFRARDGRIAALVEASDSGLRPAGGRNSRDRMLDASGNRLGIRPRKCGTCCALVRLSRSSFCGRGGASWRFPRFVSAGMGRGLMTAGRGICSDPCWT